MTDLTTTLELLQRRHHGNGPVANRGGPGAAEWVALRKKLAEIRDAAAAGDTESRDWLAINGPMITAVEA